MTQEPRLMVKRRRGERATPSGLATLGAVVTTIPPLTLGTMVGYLGLLTAAAAVARRSGSGDGRAAHRFAVLIPAHDEEQLLPGTLRALTKVDYPTELVQVHVVADNCTDATAAVARAEGAEVHERHAPSDGGKGPALTWLLERLVERGDTYDAVVVIDADTTMDQGYLRAMDAALTSGARVAQGYYAVLDPGASSTAGFRAAALALRHYVRPLGRTRLGGSSGLYGNGMAFSTEVVRGRRWSNHLTEDIELQLELLLAGTRVAFVPGAVVEAEMPATLEASRSQHERWERGRLEMVRRFVPALARRTVTGGPAGRVAYADAMLDQLVPPMSILVAGTVGWAGVTFARALVSSAPAARRHALVAAGLCAAETAIVLTSLRLAGAPPAAYRSLLGAPRQIAWKVALWCRMLGRGQRVAWVRTARNVEVSP
jgi:cellulose synthase/poly-beta-1,6-N-acetylglucosamine synthase-like glycosyltransferase